MPTHVNLRYEEIEYLWPGVVAMQSLADQYGIADISQDAGLKMLQVAIALGLDIIPGRSDADASDRLGNLYEVKTIDLAGKARGFSTSHHVTHNTLAKYRSRKWAFVTYDRITMQEAYFVESDALEPLFKKWEHKLRARDTTHLNNPKIPVDYIRENGRVAYLKDVAPDWALPVDTYVIGKHI